MAIPFDYRQRDPLRLTMLLNAAAEHPDWFSAESTPEERRTSAAMLLTAPGNQCWEVWRGGTFVGILLLWRIQPRVDALLHFLFLDRDLVGKRNLIRSFLGYCFEGPLQLQRVSFECPEFIRPLIDFARLKLGFHFEGEGRTKDHPAVQNLGKGVSGVGVMTHPNLWVAKHGSRRESAHWHKGAWHDVICLRLTRAEYEAQIGEQICPLPLSLPSPPQSSAVSLARSSAPKTPRRKPKSLTTSRAFGPTAPTSSTASSMAKAPFPASGV